MYIKRNNEREQENQFNTFLRSTIWRTKTDACTSSHLNPLKEDPWFSSVYTVRQLNKFGLMMWQDDNWPHSRHLPPSLDRFSLHRCPERRKITNLWKKVGEKGNLRFSWATMYTIALKFYLYSDIYFRYDKRTREKERDK